MAKKTEEKEEKLQMVGDHNQQPDDLPDDEALPPEKEEEEENEAKENEEEEAEDKRVGHSEEEEDEEDPERKAIRERRRLERKNRRERDARNRRELSFLRSRNEQLEREVSKIAARQDRQELMTLDERIEKVRSQLDQADDIYAKAVSNKDGNVAKEAMQVRDALRDNLKTLEEAKKTRKGKTAEESDDGDSEEPTERPTKKSGRVAPPELSEATITWFKANRGWFDPTLKDETSHIVKVMEDRLAAEGEYSSDEPEYWEELDRRIDRRFPELRKKKGKEGKKLNSREEIFDEDDEEEERPQERQKKKPGGPRFRVGGTTRPLGKNEVYINAERKKALQEAGVWDDQEARERYLKSYKKYDDEATRNS
jgi:hypothetical protein